MKRVLAQLIIIHDDDAENDGEAPTFHINTTLGASPAQRSSRNGPLSHAPRIVRQTFRELARSVDAAPRQVFGQAPTIEPVVPAELDDADDTAQGGEE